MRKIYIVYSLVKLNRKVKRVVAASALLLACAGCGGISASRSVSPASFFLPGVKAEPKQPSSDTVPQPGPVKQFAQLQ
jgi:hypothetical protein